MSNIQYPYHPATGLRLVKTIDFVPAGVAQDIIKLDGEIQYEEAGGSTMHWNNTEGQRLGGNTFLADEDGNECLSSEAVWSAVEADSIPIEVPGAHSSVTMPNSLRAQLQELASAAREVVLDTEQGSDAKASSSALKALLQQHGLWEDFEPNEA